MSHPCRDTLLSLSLDLLEAPEAKAMHRHLRSCGSCAATYRQCLDEIEVLRGVRVAVPIPALALPGKARLRGLPLWRVAAVLLVGLVGYGATELLRHPPRVEPQSLQVYAPPDSLQPRLACDPVDLLPRD